MNKKVQLNGYHFAAFNLLLVVFKTLFKWFGLALTGSVKCIIIQTLQGYTLMDRVSVH